MLRMKLSFKKSQGVFKSVNIISTNLHGILSTPYSTNLNYFHSDGIGGKTGQLTRISNGNLAFWDFHFEATRPRIPKGVSIPYKYGGFTRDFWFDLPSGCRRRDPAANFQFASTAPQVEAFTLSFELKYYNKMKEYQLELLTISQYTRVVPFPHVCAFPQRSKVADKE